MTAKESKTLQDLYRALEELPGRIRREEAGSVATPVLMRDPASAAEGADRARVLVYTWLREAGMLPPGGR